MLKAIRTIKKIKQLQKELHAFSLAFLALQDIGLMPETEKGKAKAQTMHDISHMIKDILDGKSVDEAMKRLEITVETKKTERWSRMMTRIELENRVWLLASHEEKNELLDLGLTSKARYVKRVLELGKVYAHV